MNGPVLHTIFTRTSSTVLNFAIALLIARHSGPLIKGEVTLLITIVSFYSFFSNIFGGQVLIYLIPNNKAEQVILPAYLWSLAISMLGFVFLSSTSICPSALVLPVTILGLLSSISGIHQTLLMARRQIYSANALAIIPLLFQICGLYLCYYQWNINSAEAYIYPAIIGFGFTSFYGLWLSKPEFRESQNITSIRDTLRVQFRHGLSFQGMEVLQLLQFRYYFFQLGLQQGAQYLGIFSVGISVLEAVWIIPRSMAAVNYVDTSNNKQQTTQRTIYLMKLSGFITALALLLVFITPNYLFIQIFGSGFAEVKHSIRFLYPGIFIYSFHFIMASYFLGKGAYKAILVANAIGFFTLVIAAFFLIPPYVMSGAGLSATISFVTSTTALFIFFMQEHRQTFNSR